MKKFFILFVLAVFVLPSMTLAQSERSKIVEKGTIYIEADGNTWTAAIRIPTTLPYSTMTITPRPDPDAAGNSVVGTQDFLIKSKATITDDQDYWYWRFSQTLMPKQIVGVEAVFTTGVYISNTPNATSSGSATESGQWYEWYTERVFE